MQLPFGTDVCPDCGYSLRGLVEPQRCPECGGTDLGEDVIVLWGEARADIERTSEGRDPVSAASAIGAVFTFLGVTGLIRGSVQSVVPLLIGLTILIGSYFLRGTYDRKSSPAREQLRLTPRGYATRRGVGRVRLAPWAANDRITVSMQVPSRLTVRVAPTAGFSRTALLRTAIFTHGTAEDAVTILRRTTEWITRATYDQIQSERTLNGLPLLPRIARRLGRRVGRLGNKRRRG